MSLQAATTKGGPTPAATRAEGGVLRRGCACGTNTAGGGECGPCRRKEKALQRRASGGHVDAPEIHGSVNEVLRSPGRPLDADTRAFMEPRFGHDFSHVRVHTDSRAAESARALDSLAYTVGRDLVFAAGQYAPGTTDGRRLLAHELAHVLQQGASARGESRSLQRQSVSKNTPRRPGSPPRPAPRPGTRECEDACHRDYEKCVPLRPNPLDPRCWNALQDCLRNRCGPGQTPGLPGLRGEPVIQSKLRVHSAGDVYEQEADRVAEQVVRAGVGPHAASSAGVKGFEAVGVGPSLQRQSNRDALTARLNQVRTRLAQLRAQLPRRDDAGEFAREREREALGREARRERERASANAVAPSVMGGAAVVNRFRNSLTVSRDGLNYTVRPNIQLSYLGLSDADARRRAAADIPRIEAAIRDVWQANITNGDYRGVALRFLPTVTLLPPGAQRANNNFLIEVRAPRRANPNDVFRDPSSTFGHLGVISLNPGHLQGSRVVVVAHEFGHLLGFGDTYQPTRARGGRWQSPWSLGRVDAAQSTDLFGVIDPVVLRRLQREGAARPQDAARQSGQARLWESDAITLLQNLGVEPPNRSRIPDSDEFDPEGDVEEVRREGQA
ncbi:MAG TPA: DUF4157 domain-containing protein, partial [Pyrinomonadaceae bacterium]|nr:DUF4157 domain-containing protein [Pyrinomonadaceae bacterium]